jgi:hypothetical protein
MKLRQVRNCFGILSLMVPLIVAGVAQAQETPAATPPPLKPERDCAVALVRVQQGRTSHCAACHPFRGHRI